jgi:hypothetical protein
MKNETTSMFIPLTQTTRRRVLYCLWLRLNRTLRKNENGSSPLSRSSQRSASAHDGRFSSHNLS